MCPKTHVNKIKIVTSIEICPFNFLNIKYFLSLNTKFLILDT
jgi:hypothetical protein